MSVTDPPGLDAGGPEYTLVETFAGTYRLLADCFVYPEEIDRDALLRSGREQVVPRLREQVGDEPARLVTEFLDEYEDLTVDEYVETLELEPSCPLYLGHYEFDEPETCREISDSDRNQYMVELNGVYENFGFEIGDELPDFVPAMAEFLWLTLPEREDPLRGEFAQKMHSMLPGMRKQFEASGTPYWRLVAALERVIEYDTRTFGESDQATHDPTPTTDSDSSKTDQEPTGSTSSTGGDQ